MVKGTQAGRVLVNDQIIGYLGQMIEAPVGEVGLVDVSQELIDGSAEMSHMPAGTSHGCFWIP